jgi:hypothetical protein
MYGEKRLGVIKENRFLMKKPTQNGIATPVTVTASKPPVKTSIYTLGKKHYETTDWLGNVRVTYTDKKSWQQNKFALNVSSSQDYYPFGSMMEGRKYNLSAYRYAFNTQERVPELNESHYTALYWEYDGRLARRWNVDPELDSFPSLSCFAVLKNNPFIYVDIYGNTITSLSEDEAKIVESAVDKFGGEEYVDLIKYKVNFDRKTGGFNHFARRDDKLIDEKKFSKELNKRLKRAGKEMLSETELHQACTLYMALSSPNKLELSTLSRGGGSSMRIDGSNQRTRSDVKISEIGSSNYLYNKFLDYFKADPSVLLKITGDRGYGIIDYEPMVREGDPGHLGTLVIDITNTFSKETVVQRFLKGIEMANFR